jgi:hypothetical protein
MLTAKKALTGSSRSHYAVVFLMFEKMDEYGKPDKMKDGFHKGLFSERSNPFLNKLLPQYWGIVNSISTV